MCKSSDVNMKATTTFLPDQEVSPLLLIIFPGSPMVSDGCYSWRDTVADSALDKKIAKQAEPSEAVQIFCDSGTEHGYILIAGYCIPCPGI